MIDSGEVVQLYAWPSQNRSLAFNMALLESPGVVLEYKASSFHCTSLLLSKETKGTGSIINKR